MSVVLVETMKTLEAASKGDIEALRKATDKFIETITEQPRSCKCSLCERNDKLRKIIKNKNTDELIEELKIYADLLANTEFDLSWYKAIESGNWPSAVEILEVWLKRAKDIKEIEDNKPKNW